MRVLGIDPGISGAAAIFDSAIAKLVATLDLPVIGEDKSREIDALELMRWIKDQRPDHAYVENVFAMPSIPGADGERRSMGATSAFRFGGAVYSARSAVRCAEIPMTLVVPRVWKKHFGLSGPDKEQSRLRAIHLMPELSGAFSRKKDHARAEAALIAKYGADKLAAKMGARQ